MPHAVVCGHLSRALLCKQMQAPPEPRRKQVRATHLRGEQREPQKNSAFFESERGAWGKSENFFSREKKFSPSPRTPLPLSKKAGYFCAFRWSARVCHSRLFATRLGVWVCGTRLISEHGQLPHSVSVGSELPGFSGHPVGDDYFGVIFRVHVPSLSLSVTLKFG